MEHTLDIFLVYYNFIFLVIITCNMLCIVGKKTENIIFRDFCCKLLHKWLLSLTSYHHICSVCDLLLLVIIISVIVVVVICAVLLVLLHMLSVFWLILFSLFQLVTRFVSAIKIVLLFSYSVIVWLGGLVVSALGMRTRRQRFKSWVAPIFHWVATLGKLFTHIASPVSQLQETGVQKGVFGA